MHEKKWKFIERSWICIPILAYNTKPALVLHSSIHPSVLLSDWYFEYPHLSLVLPSNDRSQLRPGPHWRVAKS